MTAMLSPVVQLMSPTHSPKPAPLRKRPRHAPPQVYDRTMEDFIEELRSIEEKLDTQSLLSYSSRLQKEYDDKLQSSQISMLPSYNHTLPSGQERGECLALDVGGSTFRIALIRLSGRDATGKSMDIRHSQSFEIVDSIKRLEGQAFFDWMADRIADMLANCPSIDHKLDMGLAWSFPIEQTCSRSGNLLKMGKGFRASAGLIGQDLSEVIMRSCTSRGLNVQMRTIINDSAGTLISQAYLDSSARMSVILGTGMNAGVFLPVQCVGKNKLVDRPESWHTVAKRVLINTEISMFGKNVMPVTRWDNHLNSRLPMPGFQPMEYLCTGMYLGEIVRLILVEAIDTAGLFNGRRPENFAEVYSLSTSTVAAFENDFTVDLSKASSEFVRAHPLLSRPSLHDLYFIKRVVTFVSHRAQAYLATAVHALWSLRTKAEAAELKDKHVTVACNGTVIDKYPGFRVNCQRHLDSLCLASGVSAGTISLEMAPESSIFGAAVAVQCATDE
ncbi:hypothetical protein AMS68_000147 [Peltaster fructicola]|uniref:Phosphotransferase n=1 Tax=Peltaster fructicola TaxID=286661 RepID=A0A6H0XJC7_9PEZI|nr:hypothetical protein AMS68_000147 [Peltaster fructicola]